MAGSSVKVRFSWSHIPDLYTTSLFLKLHYSHLGSCKILIRGYQLRRFSFDVRGCGLGIGVVVTRAKVEKQCTALHCLSLSMLAIAVGGGM